MSVILRISCGSEFQAVGPGTENASSLNLIVVGGTVLVYIGQQWRNFVPYLCQLVSAAILWVKLLEMFLTLMSLKYALSAGYWSCGHFPHLTDGILHQLTPHIMPSYTHKLAIVSRPQILWRYFTLCIWQIVCGWTRHYCWCSLELDSTEYLDVGIFCAKLCHFW